MNEPQQHDWLDDALRDGSQYIDDNGFAARVVATLPPAHKKLAFSRYAILGGVTALGLVVGLIVLPGGKFVVDSVVQLATAKSLNPSLILPALFVAIGLGASLLPVATER